jgi:hypothetical protein
MVNWPATTSSTATTIEMHIYISPLKKIL